MVFVLFIIIRIIIIIPVIIIRFIKTKEANPIIELAFVI